MVLTPAYKTPNPNIGRISWFVPGMWENASPYCHGSAFKIVADTYIKRGNVAYESMKMIMPDSEKNPSSHSGCPPYMVTNMYYGPENPRKGQILYSWITGTADWLFKAVSSHMVGVRAEYDGLLIDPCVPSWWDNFSIRREYMGATYQVNYSNPDGKESGVKEIKVDGKIIEGNVLPPFEAGTVHEVEVIM
jgi:cellobiose phosphorylase